MATRAERTDITVIGCGVSGLTCGIRLLQKGFTVRIISDKAPQHSTSSVAAAVWYYYDVDPKDAIAVYRSRFTYNRPVA